MSDHIVPIARRSNNGDAWTPAQLLDELRAAIECGEIDPLSMIVVFTEPRGDGRIGIRSWRANMSWTEEFTYLGLAQHDCLDADRTR